MGCPIPWFGDVVAWNCGNKDDIEDIQTFELEGILVVFIFDVDDDWLLFVNKIQDEDSESTNPIQGWYGLVILLLHNWLQTFDEDSVSIYGVVLGGIADDTV